MNSFNINNKILNYGSLIFSPTERYSLGMNTKISNDSIFIREEIHNKQFEISKRIKNLIKSYFSSDRINVLFIDFYSLDTKIDKSFLKRINITSDEFKSEVLLLGLRKGEETDELESRLEFAQELKNDDDKKFIILLVDPRQPIPVEMLKKYEAAYDVIGLYLNTPFGGKPLIVKIIKSNLLIWEHIEKPVFLMGAPRKINEAISKGVKFYQPFFSLLSNLYCTHFRSGPSKAKYVVPSTNSILTQEKLILSYGKDAPLSNICNCGACEDHTCASFFKGKDAEISKRIRTHETYLADMQIKEIRSLNVNDRTEYLSKKIDTELSPQIATISQLNNISIKKAISEKVLEKILEIYAKEEEMSI